MSNPAGPETQEVDVDTSDEDAWFHAARIIDPEWVELDVTTQGGVIHYRIPRRTLFDTIDR